MGQIVFVNENGSEYHCGYFNESNFHFVKVNMSLKAAATFFS